MNTLLLCLALTVFQEARGEPVVGQRAVAAVMLNRARIRNMTVCDAVMEPGQFTFHPEKYIVRARVGGEVRYRVSEDRLPTRKKGWKAAVEAAKYAIAHPLEYPDIEFFHAVRVRPAWKRTYKYVFTIGNHVFYSRNYPSGARKTAKNTPSGGVFTRFLV